MHLDNDYNEPLVIETTEQRKTSPHRLSNTASISTLIASGALPATLPNATFTTTAQFKRDWSFYFNVSTSTIGTIILAYPSIFEIFKAALSTTASLSADDLRAAFLSLNGTRSYNRPVNLNPLTGVNDGSVNGIAQPPLGRRAGAGRQRVAG